MLSQPSKGKSSENSQVIVVVVAAKEIKHKKPQGVQSKQVGQQQAS